MTKKNDPSFNGSRSPRGILPYYGSVRELSEFEYFALRIACLTPYKESEPTFVTRARSRMEIAETVRNHFLLESLAPIFDSFEYEGLRMKGVV